MEYGKRLRELRNNRGLSQKELTDRLKINRSTYARYETEATQPDYETLTKIASFYGVSIDYILGHTVQDKNITMIAGKEIDLTKYNEKELKLIEWAWNRLGLSAIDSMEDFDKKLEEISLIYDYINNKKDSKKN